MKTPITALTIYVPTDENLVEIAPGSAIVGRLLLAEDMINGRPALEIDFEGNLRNAINLRTFRERVQSAADRHAAKYPTIARKYVPTNWMKPVGSVAFRENTWVIDTIDDAAALHTWLGTKSIE